MARSSRPQYEGDPTLLRVMVRPQWIAALLLALAVAAGFAWLGRWQLGSAIRVESDHTAISETARPISEVTEPAAPVTDKAGGMVVTTSGRFVPGDFLVVEQRTNGGRSGAWVTGHFVVDGSPSAHLSVAIGWAPTVAEAERALAGVAADGTLGGEIGIEGRYMPGDAAALPEPSQDPMRLTTMVPAQQINRWAPFEGPAYAGFLVLHPQPPLDSAKLGGLGLDAIDSVPPLPVETINWLNVFYAAEWIVFAGFAVFFWYRLTRDAWEKEHELRLLETEQERDLREE